MRKLSIPNVTLMALVASCFMQIGAQLFALTVVASTVAKAPPRSFAMFQGEYGYNSTAFWDTAPAISFLLFLIAVATNWKTGRRAPLLAALGMFIVAGLTVGLLVEPFFAEILGMGFRDEVDPELKARAATWLMLDWVVWSLVLAAGITLLLALVQPVTLPQPADRGNAE